MGATQYERITINAPTRVGRLPAAIAADLVLAPGAIRTDPPYLRVSVDGGTLLDDAGATVTELRLAGAGQYRGFAAFPASEGPYQLYVSLPDGGLPATAMTLVDLTPPLGLVELSAPPPRTTSNDGGLNEVDVEAVGAYRRDEVVTIKVDSPDPSLRRADVDLVSDGGGLQPLGSADAGCTSRFDGGVCLQSRVELWTHPMRAYRDVIWLNVRVSDDVGNATSVDGGRLTVTRFKWSRGIEGSIGTLALTRNGSLVFPAYTTTTRLVALHASGRDQWARPSAGVLGAVSVGTHSDEHVYFSSADSASGTLETAAFPFADVMQTVSPVVPRTPSILETAPPVIISQSGREAAWFLGAGDTNINLYGWRFDDRATTEIDAGNRSGYQSSGAVTDNTFIFLPVWNDDAPTDLVMWAPRIGGLGPFEYPRLSLPGSVLTAAVAQSNLLYLGVQAADGGFLMSASVTGVQAPTLPLPVPEPVVLLGTNTIFVGQGFPLPIASPTLCRIPIGSVDVTCAARGTRGPMLLGAAPPGGAPILYSFASDSVVDNFLRAIDSSSLATIWEVRLRDSPLSIDCSRNVDGSPRSGVPGVLYTSSVAIVAGAVITTLRSSVVDSPGVDGTARWPMLTHDPRNTMNSQMPLTPFYCP